MLRSLKVSTAIVLFFSFCVVLAGDDNKSTIRTVDFNSETVTNIDIGSSLIPADTGFDNFVAAFANYGTDLIVGGAFSTIGGIPSVNIGGWNGSSWYAMPGISGNPIIGVLHESNGNLYAGGLLNAGPFQWDGANWSVMQPELSTTFGEAVLAIETFNNELIVGGIFSANTLLPSYIAKWNGAGWDSLGNAITGHVDHMVIYNGELIAGGQFSDTLGTGLNLIGKWNGTVWSSLDNGIRSTLDTGGTGTKAVIDGMVVYNNELIVAGRINDASGIAVNNIAKWNGSSWQAIGDGFNAAVATLSVHNNLLIAAGDFTASGDPGNLTPLNYIASWDGSSWSQVGNQIDGTVLGLGEYDGHLIAGGIFTTAGGNIALWDSSIWREVSDITLDISDGLNGQLPTGFSLDQNYPNPFNPSTNIEFNLPTRSHAKIEIFNVNGQQIKLLINQTMSVGSHSIEWDGTNEAGQKVSSGTYFYKLTTDKFSQAKKMILIK